MGNYFYNNIIFISCNALNQHHQSADTHFVSRRVFAFSLLGHVEAEVLQQDDGAGGGVSAGGFHFWTHAVLQEGDVPADTERTIRFIFMTSTGQEEIRNQNGATSVDT